MDFEGPKKSGGVQRQNSPGLKISGKSSEMEGKYDC